MLSKLVKEFTKAQKDGTELTEKLKKTERLLKEVQKTSGMDPFHDSKDKEIVLKILNKCLTSSEEYGLSSSFVAIFKNLINEINTRFDENGIKDQAENRSEDKDKESRSTDITDLRSNFVNGQHCVKSGIKFSKIMEVSFEKTKKDKVFLKASNLPEDISKEEFKAALKYLGIWITRAEVLKTGNKKLLCRVLYNKNFINFLILNPNVHIKSNNPIITQELLMIKRVVKSKKPKLKIVSFFNASKSKLKDILIEKKVRNYLKYTNIIETDQILKNEFVIDDENNIYNVMVPYKREVK